MERASARSASTAQRWQRLPRRTRRAVKARRSGSRSGCCSSGVGGVWQWSALAIAAVVLVLVVPSYDRITIGGRRVGRFIVPGAVLVLAIAYPYYASLNGR